MMDYGEDSSSRDRIAEKAERDFMRVAEKHHTHMATGGLRVGIMDGHEHIRDITFADLDALCGFVRAHPLPENLSYDFGSLRLDGADFTGTRLVEANFANCSLTSAKFSGAELSRSNFNNADLAGADFSNSRMCQSFLRKTTLHRVNFTHAVMEDAKLHDADLTGARISPAQIRSILGAPACLPQSTAKHVKKLRPRPGGRGVA